MLVQFIHWNLEESMRTLKDLKVGETATVVRVSGEGALRRLIMDMGSTKGVQVFGRKVTRLGDLIEVYIRDNELSPRRADCERIEAELERDIVL